MKTLWLLCSFVLIAWPAKVEGQSYAPYSEFQSMTTLQVQRIQLKLTCMWYGHPAQTVVLTTTGYSPNVSAFTAYRRSGHEDRYRRDQNQVRNLQISTTQMKAIIDGVATVSAVTDGGIDSDGSLSFALHDVVSGNTKVFESILAVTNGKLLFEKILSAVGTSAAVKSELVDYACGLGMRPGSPPTEVTSQVSIQMRGTRLNRSTGSYVSTIRVTNTSGQTITGPLIFVLALAGNVELSNGSGRTCLVQPAGMYTYTLTGGDLGSGQSVEAILMFANSEQEPIELVIKKVFRANGTL